MSLQLALGVIYTLAGTYFMTHTLVALGTLTHLLAAILLAEAVLETIGYFTL